MTVGGTSTAGGLFGSRPEEGEQQDIVVRSLLIPVSGTYLLLPNAAVAEVTHYGEVVPIGGAPGWLLGIASWRGRDLPLVSFEVLARLPAAESPKDRRLVVCNTLNGNPELPFIGLAAGGIPRLLQVNGAALERSDSGEQPGERMYVPVSLKGEAAVIPDLDVLENLVTQVIGRQ